MQTIGTLGGNSTATGINNSGVVTGFSTDSSGYDYAFIYDNGVMNKLETSSGSVSYAVSINETNQIVGDQVKNDDYESHACLWQDGKRYDLEILSGFSDSSAKDINNLGQIVGVVSYPGKAHAALWENGIVIDLNNLISSSSGWELEFAEAINDSGQIVGFGNINGETHAFLLTSIPEPISFVFMLVGLLGFAKIMFTKGFLK
jgi:probable HAF family extracellular repeat protein